MSSTMSTSVLKLNRLKPIQKHSSDYVNNVQLSDNISEMRKDSSDNGHPVNNIQLIDNFSEREKDFKNDITEEQFADLILTKVFVGVKEEAMLLVIEACNVAIHLYAKAFEQLLYIGVIKNLSSNYLTKYLSSLLDIPEPGKEEVRRVNSPHRYDKMSLLSFICLCLCIWVTFLLCTTVLQSAELVSPLQTLAAPAQTLENTRTELENKSMQDLQFALAKDCLKNTYHCAVKTKQHLSLPMIMISMNLLVLSAILVELKVKTICNVLNNFRAICHVLNNFQSYYHDGNPSFMVVTMYMNSDPMSKFHLLFMRLDDCVPLLPLFNKVSLPGPDNCCPWTTRYIIAFQDLSYQVEQCFGSNNIANWTSKCPLFDRSDVQDHLDSIFLNCPFIGTIHDQQINNATVSDEGLQFLIQKNDLSSFPVTQHELSLVDTIMATLWQSTSVSPYAPWHHCCCLSN